MESHDHTDARNIIYPSLVYPINTDFSISYVEILGYFISVIVKFISIVIGGFLAYDYYHSGDFWFFVLTTLCIIIPGFITVYLSIYLYFEDVHNKSREQKPWYDFIFTLILLPFCFRYFQSLTYAILCKRAEQRYDIEKQKYYYSLLVKEDSDIVLIRLFECYLEATPQKILQITIYLTKGQDLRVLQALSIISSLTSITWCMASYYRCIRFAQPDKRTVSYKGSIFQCCWHFCVTVSRITSICIIASIFLKYTLLASCIHALLMALWIFTFDRSPFCAKTCTHSFAFSLCLGFIYIFTYISPREVNTKYRYIIYYFISGLENLTAVVLYCIYFPENVLHFHTSVLLCVLSITSFIVGIIFMIIYYQNYHPIITARENINRQEQRY